MKTQPVVDRDSLLAFFHSLLTPLNQYRQMGNGRVNLGSSATHYSMDQAHIEGFLRQLWAVGPLYGHGVLTDADFDYYKQGILNGVDPKSGYYWGPVVSYDQLIVEMAALAVTLIETKTKFFDKLPASDQHNIYQWLNQVNHVGVPPNNWRYFRTLVNVCFIKLGLPADHERMEDDLELISSLALPRGWYCDGNPEQMDYYIPWAMQFYGLLYAHYMQKEDPKRAARLQNRAKRFAQDFKYWFDKNGAGVPFGRSLTYRFAQAAFWSVCVYTNQEVLPWGELKALIFNHLNYWRTLPIQKPDGVLSIGYGYENLYMSEHYNSPGSPYWAFKTFILLATPADHPFWAAKPVQPERQAMIHLKTPKMLITNQDGANTMMYPADQFTGQAHAAEKYSKFVYSSRFGFSVSCTTDSLEDGAFDNVLAVAEAGTSHYIEKGREEGSSVTDTYVEHDWIPLPGVAIQSWIIPLGQWHVRIHKIVAGRGLNVADGGFACPVSDGHADAHPADVISGGLTYASAAGHVATAALQGFDHVSQIFASANTNLVYPQTMILTAIGHLLAGEHLLVSAHFGGLTAPESLPQVTISGETAKVKLADKTVSLQLAPCEALV